MSVRKVLGRVGFALTVGLMVGLVLSSCASSIKSAASIDEVDGFTRKLAWIRHNGQSGGTYTVEIQRDQRMYGPNDIIGGRTGLFSYRGRDNITVILKGVGENQTIRPEFFSGTYYPGTLISVDNGVTLVLDNVTIKGTAQDEPNSNASGTSGSLVTVLSGGTLVMNEGSAIINGFNNISNGGGVTVNDGGTFHMKGGTIAGNISSPFKLLNETRTNSPRPTYGGGVYVSSGGTFTKTGGTIYGGDALESVEMSGQTRGILQSLCRPCNSAREPRNYDRGAPPGRGHAIYFASATPTALDAEIGPETQLSFSGGRLTQSEGAGDGSDCGNDEEGEANPVGSVKIGDLTWTKQNVNIKTPDSWCYENNPSNCAKYGRLYTWEAAKKVCQCMGGSWRLPTNDDWNNLMMAVGGVREVNEERDVFSYKDAGKKLKSESGWGRCDHEGKDCVDNGNGTDDYGFSALPGGVRGGSTGGSSYGIAGSYGNWWSATEYGSVNAYIWSMLYNGDEVFGLERGVVRAGLSARCVAQE